MDYQWEVGGKPTKSSYEPRFGPQVIARDEGKATRVRIRLLVDHPDAVVFLTGPFNEWGEKLRRKDRFTPDEHGLYAELETEDLTHGTPYRLRIADKQYPDPASVYLDDDGNSVFFDFDDPSIYQLEAGRPERRRSIKVLQSDLPGLVAHWKGKDGRIGREVPRRQVYRFIAESGVIDEIKRLGFNAIQFLPFAQSIDGDNWKFRYLVPFPFAINRAWGSPEDFRRMVDAFHAAGINVIADIVVGHMPHKDFRVLGFESLGVQDWIGRTGQRVFMKEYTEWGTMRPDYDNEHVRRWLVDSAIHFLDRYGIDGFRIDNVDGILRHGANGQGPQRPAGRKFLQELNEEIYAHDPDSLIHFEAHYFIEDNAKMLVAPLGSDPRALGATAYTSSRLTYYFHKEYMPKDVEKISPWRFKHIVEEKEWGKSNSTIADFHNHDAAAGLMPMRATGSYAYDAMTVDPYNHIHALGKIKVMEAIIAFGCEGRILDLLQTFLLQTGTFEHDSSIHWHLTFNEANKGVLDYKKAINEMLDHEAFWPQHTDKRTYLNVDDANKILVIERSDGKDRFVILINLGAGKIYDYRVGLRTKKDLKVVFNSDSFKYAGFGVVSYPEVLRNQESRSFEVLDREVLLDVVAPYGVVVMKEQ